MTEALRRSAKMRGLGLSDDQLEGYVSALANENPIKVWDALCGLFRDNDDHRMPTPAAIRERIRTDGRTRVARQPLLPEPSLTEREHAFGLECAKNCSLLLARKIDGKETDRRMVEAAKRHGVYDAIKGQPGCDGVPL